MDTRAAWPVTLTCSTAVTVGAWTLFADLDAFDP